MLLVLTQLFISFSANSAWDALSPLIDNNLEITNSSVVICPHFENVKHGTVGIQIVAFNQLAMISCDDGYDLYGDSTVYCIEGTWKQRSSSQCIKRCHPPPFVANGELEIEGEKDKWGFYHKGTVATYTCADGYYLRPIESRYRVCEKGIWTGASAKCIVKELECPLIQTMLNGYIARSVNGHHIQYSCKAGYTLSGTSVQQCLDDGTWSPESPPKCILRRKPENEYAPCGAVRAIAHTDITIVEGFQSDDSAIPGTEIEIRCINGYRNSRNQCRPNKLKCVGGKWIGTLPICELATECPPPPIVPNANITTINFSSYGGSFARSFPIRSQISYECSRGYDLEGNDIMTCAHSGCWFPSEPPTCLRTSDSLYLEISSINAILITAATGAGVLGFLLIICMVVVCKRRQPTSRPAMISPPPQRHNLNDHATLLNPDRLALIAFADGMQNGSQASLPTYDEATRERVPGLTVNRLHRPHWPNLGGRRARNSPNPDFVHVTRQGSFASHTPSTRSTGDSMGSTDTMAVSEGSTNITLDTASSQSGSQAASCRVHCGSIASFDTCSVVNTEGVPLLEESELEDVQGGDNVSVVLDNCNISDNSSIKLSTTSADVL